MDNDIAKQHNSSKQKPFNTREGDNNLRPNQTLLTGIIWVNGSVDVACGYDKHIIPYLVCILSFQIKSRTIS